ncbi:hypothetical protein B0A52_07117 [Exophiala mesophila]|uniref:NADP-dependent oxidoreductase domain-containing protein n=1 Tax=Exophiala mesophila TaxID=212818 RepID=A0A438MY69_EXOME|nr:hypothetical protein B0A52_07117 [Exophiala mesophila]
MPRPTRPLSDSLPPLIFGTATFNYQYNVDPYALSTTALVQSALVNGVHAFDTSPYYGPAEEILGAALDSDFIRTHFPRQTYHILTKVGRVAADEFDYSPEWIRKSVQRSCKRLRTTYLDVVYCHDCEFVSPQEVLTAVTELRRIRDQEGTLQYVGISGYPVDVLCQLAEMILRETGEPIDIVQSYANYTLQNTRLMSHGLQPLLNSGVDVVTNASPLGMGILRRNGPSVGAMGNWHPAPDDLRQACIDAGAWANARGEKLEVIAVRFALESWLRDGASAGTYASPYSTSDPTSTLTTYKSRERIGVSVIGVSKIEELDETIRIWRSVLDGLADDLDADLGTITPSESVSDHDWSLLRRQTIRVLARGIRDVIGPRWVDHAWDSPEPGFVNKRTLQHLDKAKVEYSVAVEAIPDTAMLTPPSEADDSDRLEEVPPLCSVSSG